VLQHLNAGRTPVAARNWAAKCMRVRPVDHYPDQLLANLKAIAPRHQDDPTVVILTPALVEGWPRASRWRLASALTGTVGAIVFATLRTLAIISSRRAVNTPTLIACVIVDMPFASYQETPSLAYRNAARVLAESGCDGIKLEGGVEMADTIAFLVTRGIPVMGHVGLTPQSVHRFGGYRIQGRSPAASRRILADARAVAEAGAFTIVIEGVVETLARDITNAVPVPTIGIGASADCDGQVLVTEDLVGLFSDFTPSFVRRYAELGQALSDAVATYAADVRARRFPGPEHCFPPPGRKKR